LNRRGQAVGGLVHIFGNDSIIQLNANGSPDGFSLNFHFSDKQGNGCVHVLFFISIGGVGL
jgi:hypothetical protein